MLNNNLEISVAELKEKLDSKENIFLLDVREVKEYEICKLDGSTLIPLSEFGNRFKELDPNQDIVVYCKSGGRSSNAVNFLHTQGFEKVKNLVGGILAWAKQIDPTMPQY